MVKTSLGNVVQRHLGMHGELYVQYSWKNHDPIALSQFRSSFDECSCLWSR